jgi:hypothetical protein
MIDPRGRGRMTRRHWAVTCALVAAAVVPLSLAGLASAASAANPLTHQAVHWGSYFGDKNHADSDTERSPTPIALDGRVVQVASSNSTGYALLKTGQVWAWGRVTTASWATGATPTPSIPPSGWPSRPV